MSTETKKTASAVAATSAVTAAAASFVNPIEGLPADWNCSKAMAAIQNCKNVETRNYAISCYKTVENGLKACRDNAALRESFKTNNKGKRLLSHIVTVCNAVMPKVEKTKVAGVAGVASVANKVAPVKK